jgi:hypothetical protein
MLASLAALRAKAMGFYSLYRVGRRYGALGVLFGL